MRYNYTIYFRNPGLIAMLLICIVTSLVSQNPDDNNSRKISPEDYALISNFVDNKEAIHTAKAVIDKALSFGKKVDSLTAEDLRHLSIN